MTDFICDPDTGGSPSRDYVSCYACVAGEAGDQGGNSLVMRMRSTAGSADTSRVSLTTAITNYSTVEIRPYSGEEHSGYWDSSKARLHDIGSWANAITVGIPGVIIGGLQIRVDGDYGAGVDVAVGTAGAAVSVTNNLLRYGGPTASVSASSVAVRVSNGTAAQQPIKISCNIMYGGWGYGQSGSSGLTDVDRNTMHGCNWGIKCGYTANELTWRGNLVISSRTSDFQYGYSGGGSGNANGTSDASSPDGAGYQNLSITFADPANGDFNLVAGDTDAIDAGVSIAGITADIVGTAIPQGVHEDLGAFERPIGGLTTVNADLNLQWNILVSITFDINLRWQIINAVESDLPLAWNLLTSATNDLPLAWSTLNALTADLDTRWDIQSALSSVSADLGLQWNALSAVTSDIDLRWQILTAVDSDIQLAWDLLNSTTGDVQLAWDTLNALTANLDTRWSILESVNADVDLRWDIQSALSSVAADLGLQWNTQQGVSNDLALQWDIRNAIVATLDTRWDILNTLGMDLDMRWHIATAVAADLALQWNTLQGVSADADLRWNTLEATGNSLSLQWSIGDQILTPITFIPIPAEVRVFQVH